jgi:phosphate transport system permease protein
MMRPPLSPRELLRAPLPRTSQFLMPAFVWAVVAAPIVVLAVTVMLLMIFATAPNFETLLPRLLKWSLALIPFLFVVRLFILSRVFADRIFSWIGFSATFFGLAILVLFFGRMGYLGSVWFKTTPELVRKKNAELEDKVRKSQEMIDNEVAKVREEMKDEIAKAATDAEKKEIEEIFVKEIIPEKRAQFEKIAGYHIQERDQGLRPDTSSVGVLWHFLTNATADSANPQNAGIYPALIGSLLVSLITICFAVPVGVAAALYLEEYRANSRLGRLIQININNLAGVPSVVFGILGGAIFFEIFSVFARYNPAIHPRNVIGGGLTLGLLTLPVVIVASQEAIRAVPSSIRMGAYALGATKWQTIWRQVLPLAWPGILTGTILALSRAVGEAAPLVLFGATQFTTTTPGAFTPFTVLPLQIFQWSSQPEDEWRYNAAMACLVLIVLLLALNAVAIWMRNRAQRRLKW